MAKEASRVRRRERKNISSGVAHVNSTFNNTMITLTDAQGHAIAWSSAGAQGFKGSRDTDPAQWLPAAQEAPGLTFKNCPRRSASALLCGVPIARHDWMVAGKGRKTS